MSEKERKRREYLRKLSLALQKLSPEEIRLALEIVSLLAKYAEKPSEHAYSRLLKSLILFKSLMTKKPPPDEPRRKPKPKKKGDEE